MVNDVQQIDFPELHPHSRDSLVIPLRIVIRVTRLTIPMFYWQSDGAESISVDSFVTRCEVSSTRLRSRYVINFKRPFSSRPLNNIESNQIFTICNVVRRIRFHSLMDPIQSIPICYGLYRILFIPSRKFYNTSQITKKYEWITRMRNLLAIGWLYDE